MERAVSGEKVATSAGVAAVSDRELLQRIAGGDDHALGAIYDRHGPLTYAMVLRMVGVEEDAEEITADVFSQIWRSAGGFDADRGGVGAWIVTIARSRALDRIRARRRSAQLIERAALLGADAVAVSAATAAPASRKVEERELSEIVLRALDALPETQRHVIELAYYDGLSQSEIADRLSQPLGTVKTRMRTAMLRLRDHLSPALGMEAT